MNNLQLPDQTGKFIQWPQNKVRWLIYYYLVGLVVGLYLMFMHEWLLAWEWPRLAKILFVTLFAPSGFTALSVIFARRGGLWGLFQ